MGNPNQHDWAGIDLVVKSVRTGANKPGDQGTAIADTETPTFESVTVEASGSLTLDAMVIDAPSAATAAGTGAGSAGNTGGAVATHVIPVKFGETTYYIPLCATNA